MNNTISNLEKILKYTRTLLASRCLAIKDECLRLDMPYTKLEDAEKATKLKIKRDRVDSAIEALDHSLSAVALENEETLTSLLTIYSNNLKIVDELLKEITSDTEYVKMVNSKATSNMLYYIRDTYAKGAEKKILTKVIERVEAK